MRRISLVSMTMGEGKIDFLSMRFGVCIFWTQVMFDYFSQKKDF